MSQPYPNSVNHRRRLISRWPGRITGALVGLTAGVGVLFWLAKRQSDEVHLWGREEIECKKAVAGLIGKLDLADRGAGFDAEKAKAAGKTLAHRQDALLVKAQLDRGIPRENLRLKIQAEADLKIANQQKQLISINGITEWLASLEPKKEDVGPLDAKLWAIPANLPAPRFVLVAVDTALEVPAKAAEAAEGSEELALMKKDLASLQMLEGTAKIREQALGRLLKDKAFQNPLPGFSRALVEVYEGIAGGDSISNLAKAEMQSREAALVAANMATATLRKLGKPDDALATAPENHIKNRIELMRAVEGAFRAGDRNVVAVFKNDPAFRQVIEFAKSINSETFYLNKVRASDLPQPRRIQLIDLLFACEPQARWLTKWVAQGSPLPGDLQPKKPMGGAP
jgi:hypothetical protein